MHITPIISYNNVDSSSAVENLVRRRIGALEKRFVPIIGCEVTMDAAQSMTRNGRLFRVGVNLDLPDPDLSVSRQYAEGSAQDDLILAVNRAFGVVEKVIKRRKKSKQDVDEMHGSPSTGLRVDRDHNF